jgi:CubicO group peptidase (beta-lactamase class C family)
MTVTPLASASRAANATAFPQMAGLPNAHSPEEVGFSAGRLERITAVFQDDIDNGRLPGAVILVARDGKVAYHNALGFQNREQQIAMKTDSIFRIASLTKPITSAGVMMLVEEGRLRLEDSIADYLPELKSLTVGVETIDKKTGKPRLALEPAQREITVQDLMRHTSGFTYGHFGPSLVSKTYLENKVSDPSIDLAEFVRRLAKAPLAYQPGTTWNYSMSVDVLGRIIEVVAGVPLDRFIAERITRPLGMDSTGFHVGDDKLGRLAEAQVEPATGKRPQLRNVTDPPVFLSGGGGLASTVPDYARFSQMLLDGGALDGVRLLSPRTVAYMASNHLPPDVKYDPFYAGDGDWTMISPTPARAQGFGLGFAVRLERGRNPLAGSPGEFYWVGASGTAFWVDPQEKLIAVLMSQMGWSETGRYRSLLRSLVYQALVG